MSSPEAVTQAPAGTKPRVFSGAQPTGGLHLGNYLGALVRWVEKQHERDNIFCIVDLHALTVPESIEPQKLRERSRGLAALYIAAGIDPEGSTVFVQSQVHEHAELTWLLNCVTPLGWLYRMTQFKSKSENAQSVGMGLLDYPVLMAADILLYDTQIVPVGEDQIQHIELTRDIAVRFNHLFGEVFTIPAAEIPPSGARVMGLDDPTVKMSKSLAHQPGHAVELLDSDKAIRKAIMSAVTDSGREVQPEAASPGIRNLLDLYGTIRGISLEAAGAEFAGRGYGDLKKAVAEAVIETLTPVRERYHALMDDPQALDDLLLHGAERARSIAAPVLKRVKDAMGVG
jgi:tryptophanyl-tRNA synthetase